MTPEESEEVVRLLTAARSDLRAAKALSGDPEQADEIIGFHAQQALEKAIKAVLVSSGLEIPYTHDIRYLLDLSVDHTQTMPEIVAESDWLTPWAVAARYGTADASLDREGSITVADAAVKWATATVRKQA